MANYRSPFAFLPNQHMRLVGIIAAHWEFLDFALGLALAAVMEHEHGRVALLTENVPFRAKLELLMSYARDALEADKPNKLWKDFTKLRGEVQKAYDIRNKYVHARWIRGKTASMPIRVVVSIKGGRFQVADEPTPVSELEEAAQLIHDTGERLTIYFRQFDMLKP